MRQVVCKQGCGIHARTSPEHAQKRDIELDEVFSKIGNPTHMCITLWASSIMHCVASASGGATFCALLKKPFLSEERAERESDADGGGSQASKIPGTLSRATSVPSAWRLKT